MILNSIPVITGVHRTFDVVAAPPGSEGRVLGPELLTTVVTTRQHATSGGSRASSLEGIGLTLETLEG